MATLQIDYPHVFKSNVKLDMYDLIDREYIRIRRIIEKYIKLSEKHNFELGQRQFNYHLNRLINTYMLLKNSDVTKIKNIRNHIPKDPYSSDLYIPTFNEIRETVSYYIEQYHVGGFPRRPPLLV